ncbi:MAG: xanthine dehydrogenase accessory protein XdhC, partial [Pseudomonadota bacterium]
MELPSNHWDKLASRLKQGLVSVVQIVSIRGSAPREIGASMMIGQDGRFTGTIGGGTLEWQALSHAQALMGKRDDYVEQRKFTLGASLGQCCGGGVELLFEVFSTQRLEEVLDLAKCQAKGPMVLKGQIKSNRMKREILDLPVYVAEHKIGLQSDGTFIEIYNRALQALDLFGAGHVGKAVVIALAPLDFSVRWVDQRGDIFPSMMPYHTQKMVLDNPLNLFKQVRPFSFAMIMTHSHALDYELVAHALLESNY